MIHFYCCSLLILVKRLKIKAPLFGVIALILNAACSPRYQNSTAVASESLSEAIKYCPDGLVAHIQNLDNGTVFNETYRVSNGACIIEKQNDGGSQKFYSYYGFTPSESFINKQEVSAGYGEILIERKQEASFEQNWFGPGRSFVTLTKIDDEVYKTDNADYPTISINYHNTTRGGITDMKLKFSYLPDGKVFLSEKISGSPDHRVPNIRALGVSYH